ncbi:MAG TPA: SAM-dependent methyltransferase [Chthoniobacteraceae bacterium]|jgi:SAM-dependent MidA family methyltransferase|nr:SAM-dependent methyltransferase [Chthoniobacteraceae bacterium]
MNALTSILADRIDAAGPLSFAEFMEVALYHPEHGYYASGRAAIGRGGDYFTNISVGPLFGRLLMREFAEMWARLGRPASFTVVEQGAHAGDFAHDVLEGARALEPGFFEAVRYTIIEPIPAQAERQRTRLSSLAEKLTWFETLTSLPPFEGVHFSNELLDAFPVHRVHFCNSEWRVHRVDYNEDEGSFVWADRPLTNEALRAHLATLPTDLPDGYTTEVNLLAAPWISEVSSKLQRGWVLAIDYGYPRAEYYRPERSGGTLSAYAKHRRVDDPLSSPGEIDLTAHVDFSALAEAARHAGLRVSGFTDQHHFMVGLARLHFRDAAEMTPALEKEHRAFKTLMHPNLMGSAFKAICLAKHVMETPLSGFTFASAGDRL